MNQLAVPSNSPRQALNSVTESTLALTLLFTPLARNVSLPECLPRAELHEALHLTLAERLAHICLPLLDVEYALFRHQRSGGFLPVERSSALYEEFLANLGEGGWDQLLAERPVLDRLVTLTTERWRATVTELFERLARDADTLSATFGVTGAPTQVRLGISDPHNGGRTAAVLTFASGRRLLYKPKDLSVDRAWRAFAAWLEEYGAPWHPVVPAVVSRELYGWTSFVEMQPCTNVAEQSAFFTSLGSMLALLHLLGATDCHRENFVAHGVEPVLVDLETLLHPRPKHDPMPEAMRESVLAVEMLPCRYIGAGKQEIYFPGFDGEWETIASTVIPTVPSSLSLREHAKPFCAGFAAMYEFLQNHKKHLADLNTGPLAAFRNCAVRYIHRPTMTYALTLRRALRHLDSGARWTLPFAELQHYDPPGLRDDAGATLRAAEHTALEHLDIPFFTARSDATHLYWENGGHLADFFDEPALDRASQRANRFSLTDLTGQLELIHQALAGRRAKTA